MIFRNKILTKCFFEFQADIDCTKGTGGVYSNGLSNIQLGSRSNTSYQVDDEKAFDKLRRTKKSGVLTM